MGRKMSDNNTTQVAIACQGGGSHTAFTAGVLKQLLKEKQPTHEIIALSGTSGGAVCALMTWYGLHTGGEQRAIELLDAVWEDISATSIPDQLMSTASVMSARIAEGGGWMPQLSPYSHPFSDWGRAQFEQILKHHVDFDRVDTQMSKSSPRLIVGAINVNQGSFKAFENEAITADAVLASAAIPSLFEAVKIEGDWYWDGLFSQNPPIREFLEDPDNVDEKPDEIWVIQINPQERSGEPKSLEAIADRRNELAGNLSLNQELDFIEKVNEWVDEDKLSDEYKPINIRRIKLPRKLDTPSKLNRSPRFIRELMNLGEKQADSFLSNQ